MAGIVGAYTVGSFTSPQDGDDLDASVVVANDNATRAAFVAHDADGTIHIQSSTLASRPGAGVAQRVWITTDSYRAYLDTGAAWQELAYFSGAASLLFGTDNAFDIGALAANRPRNVYIAGTLTATGGATIGSTLDLTTHNIVNVGAFSGTSINVTSSGIFGGGLQTNSYLQLNVPAISFVGGYVGAAQTAGHLINGSAQGDLCIRQQNQSMRFSIDDGGTSNVTLNSTGLYLGKPLYMGVDNTYDIGASGANRPRNLYLAGAATIGGAVVVSGTTTLSGTVFHSGAAIGFYGAGASTQQSVTGSRTGKDTLAVQLLNCLAQLGLIANNTTP